MIKKLIFPFDSDRYWFDVISVFKMQNIFMSVNVRTNSFCPNSSFTQMYNT